MAAHNGSISRVIDKVARTIPAPLKRLVPPRMKDALLGTQSRLPPLPSVPYLADLMRNYRTNRLVHVDAATFRAEIHRFVALRGAKMEGYPDAEKQRDLSIKFHWGHNH